MNPNQDSERQRQRLSRRAFMQMTGVAAAGLLASDLHRVAPAEASTTKAVAHLIPADKRLDPAWLRLLSERGKPAVYTAARDELRYIGMPIGGIACGQLYLGGDGRLWHWGIFQAQYQSPYGSLSMGIHYANPPQPTDQAEHPLQHGFALRVKQGEQSRTRLLDQRGFKDISFRGQYPLGTVTYRDDALPVQVKLEAFSPFIPLNAEESALPCTLLHYTVTNTSENPVEVDIAGWMENAVCPQQTQSRRYVRRVSLQDRGFVCSAHSGKLRTSEAPARPDILFEDFESASYGDWTSTGAAFGAGPVSKQDIPSYQGRVGGHGQRVVNSHASAPGEDVRERDSRTGTLRSPGFVIQRKYIHFHIGGGAHKGQTCLNLLIDGKVAQGATGQNDNRMQPAAFDVTAYAGQEARLQIVDQGKVGWGNIGVDHIVFSDKPLDPEDRPLEESFGYGTMALHALSDHQTYTAHLAPGTLDTERAFAALDRAETEAVDIRAETGFDRRPAAALGQSVRLKPGESQTVTFVLAWHFPHFPQIRGEMSAITGLPQLKRHYAKRFADAAAVVRYVDRHYARLADTTRLWVKTWHDSSLPSWLLDRVMIATDCLATTTLYWFNSGRVWAWEGMDCCPGTCQHVWNYAQGMARLFPELERSLREQTDFGLAWHEDGAIDYRGESGRHVAHDGLCGTIMRLWREHTLCADGAFLKRLWPRVRQTIQYMIDYDQDNNGLIEAAQYNTLDQAWLGPMAWISSLYLGALAAGVNMAKDMGDDTFAATCQQIIDQGKTSLVEQLFNGEYFIHKPPHYKNTNTNRGCHIDQVLGQSWACQYGLQRVVPKAQTDSALKSIWKYNFAPDAGAYRNKMQSTIKGGRWYAMPGEAGLLMTTWPIGGADKARGSGKVFEVGVGYFNECMNGFEYQVAAHMIHEGLVEKGLALARAVHDRYAVDRRNPYNEIECSDHYSRSMASYGVFLALCGFAYHGPQGHLAFAPRVTPEDFKAPFTAAQGWGSFTQKRSAQTQTASIELKWGKLSINTLALELPEGKIANVTQVECAGRRIKAKLQRDGQRVTLTLKETICLTPNQSLEIRMALSDRR